MMFGHGSAVEAHNKFGGGIGYEEKYAIKRPDLQKKIDNYNLYHIGQPQELKVREVNNRLVLEGQLRVYWGVVRPIQFKAKDDGPPPTPKSWRKSYGMAIGNGFDDLLQQADSGDESPVTESKAHPLLTQRFSSNGVKLRSKDDSSIPSPESSPEKNKSKTLDIRRNRRKDRRKRLSIINGHLYDLDTSVFTPSNGMVTSVRITSLDPSHEVIRVLLEKFKVLNDPEEFCLSAVTISREHKVLKDEDLPLIERVILGPLDDEAKIFITEKDRSTNISVEVASYMALPEPVLLGFLKRIEEEEAEEKLVIEKKYRRLRRILDDKLSESHA